MGWWDSLKDRVFRNYGDRMSGRWRARGSFYSESYQFMAQCPELPAEDNPYDKSPDQLMSPHDRYRLERYKFSRALNSGDHYNAFRFAQYLYASGALDDDVRVRELFSRGGLDVVFLANNILEDAAEVFADLISESLGAITATEDEAAQKAIDRIIKNSDLKQLVQMSAVTGFYKGDIVWSVHGDEKGVRIRSRRVNDWLPVIDPTDCMAWREHVFCFRRSWEGKEYAMLERYLPGRIEVEAREVNGNVLKARADQAVFAALWGEDIQPVYNFGGWDDFLCRHLPNKITDDDNPFGDSSYTASVQAMMDELNHRLTQLANELDKHARLGAQGPPLGGDETENPENQIQPNRGPSGKYIEVLEGEQRVEYIAYPSAHLASLFQEIGFLCEEICRRLRISPRLLGYKQGAAEEAFDTLRLACINTLLKNKTYTRGMKTQIEWALRAAMYLENEYKIDGAVKNWDDVELSIPFGDGFPMDVEKIARYWSLRVPGKQLGTVRQAVADLDGPEGVDQTLEEIRRESAEELETVPGLGTRNRRPLNLEKPAEEPEINAGQEEPGKPVQAR